MNTLKIRRNIALTFSLALLPAFLSGSVSAHQQKTSAPPIKKSVPTVKPPAIKKPPSIRRPVARPEQKPAVGQRQISKPITHTLPDHSSVVTDRDGKPKDVHVASHNMDIHHGLNGNRRVEVQRADHSRVVAERGGRGYVERPYHYGSRDFAHRTYYYNGRTYDRYYGQYYYRGAYVNYYTPAFYYQPAFYGWAYNPWTNPISYSWGWAGNPWYGYYGYYFTPYRAYANASLWLTDYLISTSLAAAYQAQADSAAGIAQGEPAGAVPLTPAAKDLISAEVQRQIALENAEAQAAQTAPASVPDPASSSVQRMLNDGVQHVFVAGSDLDLVDSAGAECAVSEGDALQLAGSPQPEAAANLLVLSDKGGAECKEGDTVSVPITDLQDMQNHMRETIEQGMGELKAKQGNGTIPALPASAKGEPVKAGFTAGAPPADPIVASEINQQTMAADQAEPRVLAQVQQDTGQQQADSNGQGPPAIQPAAKPVQISLGQSMQEVTTALGQPLSIANLGTKTISFYKDLKIIFQASRVSEVQ